MHSTGLSLHSRSHENPPPLPRQPRGDFVVDRRRAGGAVGAGVGERACVCVKERERVVEQGEGGVVSVDGGSGSGSGGGSGALPPGGRMPSILLSLALSLALSPSKQNLSLSDRLTSKLPGRRLGRARSARCHARDIERKGIVEFL